MRLSNLDTSITAKVRNSLDANLTVLPQAPCSPAVLPVLTHTRQADVKLPQLLLLYTFLGRRALADTLV